MQPLKDAERSPGVHTRKEIGFAVSVTQSHREENSAFVFVLILDLKAEFRRQPASRPRKPALPQATRCIRGGLIP